VFQKILHSLQVRKIRFPASRPDDVSSCPNTQLSKAPAVQTTWHTVQTHIRLKHLMSIMIFRKLWMISIWILFCYKRRASLYSLWKTSIGFLRRNQWSWASLFVDVYIHFSLCDFLAFKTLANNYLGLKDHKIFSQGDDIFQSRASLSSAEIRELMIANRNSRCRAIKLVIMSLQTDSDRRGVRKIGLRLGNKATPSTHLFFFKKKIRNKILVFFFLIFFLDFWIFCFLNFFIL
jgi:hypothetical protein